MVEPVVVRIKTAGAKQAKREIDSAATSADRLAASDQRVERQANKTTAAMRRQTEAVKKWRQENDQRLRPSPVPAQQGRGFIVGGRVLSSLGGEAGRFGERVAQGATDRGIASLGILATGISVVTASLLAADRRKVDSAERIVREQTKLAEMVRNVREKMGRDAAAGFTANMQTIERLQFQLGPEGSLRAQALQREGFATAPQALVELQRFTDQQRFWVLNIAKTVSKLGGGSLQSLVAGTTGSAARLATTDPVRAAEDMLRRTTGTGLTPEQRAIVRRGIETSVTGGTFQPFGEVSRLRGIAGTVAATQFGAALDTGRVETGLRSQLAEVNNPLAAALVELNRSQEAEIRAIEARVQAQGKVGEYLGRVGVLVGGEGSEEQKRNRRLTEIGAVTP